VNEQDKAVRSFVYTRFIETQRAPTVLEISDGLSLSVQEVESSLKRLQDLHVLVLEHNSSEIRMAMPFSAVPTRFRVDAARRSWWANCAWDAFGILAALHSDGEVQSVCPDCDRPIVVRVEDSKVPHSTELIHFAVPAARWWEDIGFT
jgi:Alkylmercury lyase